MRRAEQINAKNEQLSDCTNEKDRLAGVSSCSTRLSLYFIQSLLHQRPKLQDYCTLVYTIVHTYCSNICHKLLSKSLLLFSGCLIACWYQALEEMEDENARLRAELLALQSKSMDSDDTSFNMREKQREMDMLLDQLRKENAGLRGDKDSLLANIVMLKGRGKIKAHSTEEEMRKLRAQVRAKGSAGSQMRRHCRRLRWWHRWLKCVVAQVKELMDEARLMRQQLLDVQNESNEAIDLKAQLAALQVAGSLVAAVRGNGEMRLVSDWSVHRLKWIGCARTLKLSVCLRPSL